MIAYSVSSTRKLLSIGKYLTAVEGGQEIDVHAYGFSKDCRMNVKWKPLFLTAEGNPSFAGEGSSEKPMVERIPTKAVIRTVGLSQYGALGHRHTRELDRQGWSCRAHHEVQECAAVSRLSYLILGAPGDPAPGPESVAAWMECCFDVEKIIKNAEGPPHERLKWPHEAFGRVGSGSPARALKNF